MKRWLLLLAACSGHTHHTTDASPLDAPTDSLPISSDAAPSSVRLRVTMQGHPVANVATVFLSSDGSKSAAVTTDASGTAAALVDPGGSVTAIIHIGMNDDELHTFTAVQPGDALELDLQPAGPAAGGQITMTAATDATAYDYSLYSSCGERTGSIDGTFTFVPEGCGPTADFVVSANDTGEQPFEFIVARGLSLAGSPAIPGTYAPPRDPALGYSSIPSVVESIAAHVDVLGAGNGSVFPFDNAAPVTGGSITVHGAIPDTAGLGMNMRVSSQLYPISNELGQQGIHEVVPADQAYNLDVTNAMVPRYVAAPTYDVATRSISWGEAATSTPANLVRARIHVYRDDIPYGHAWSWEIVAAKNGTNVTFPTLAAVSGFSFIPVASDTVAIDELTTEAIEGGYDTNRPHAFDDPVPQLTSGRVTIEVLYSPPM
jgi:hypothetical protein